MQPLELNADLLERAEANARSGGFVSLRAYIEHVLEQEFARIKEPDSDEQTQNEEIVRKMEQPDISTKASISDRSRVASSACLLEFADSRSATFLSPPRLATPNSKLLSPASSPRESSSFLVEHTQASGGVIVQPR